MERMLLLKINNKYSNKFNVSMCVFYGCTKNINSNGHQDIRRV